MQANWIDSYCTNVWQGSIDLGMFFFFKDCIFQLVGMAKLFATNSLGSIYTHFRSTALIDTVDMKSSSCTFTMYEELIVRICSLCRFCSLLQARNCRHVLIHSSLWVTDTLNIASSHESFFLLGATKPPNHHLMAT